MRGIYTIRVKESNKSIDMDLPQNTNIEEVSALIVELLKKTNLFQLKKNVYTLYSKDLNRTLGNKETLTSVCLWEGSVLILI